MRFGRCLIIAEAGVNHNGSLRLAKKLIHEAKRAGADAVKFQSFHAEKVVSRYALKAEYQIKTVSGPKTQLEMLQHLELNSKDHEALFAHARKEKIQFLSTAFDEGSVDLLDRLGISLFKIPSGEITNFPLMTHIAKKGKPIILSTGMSTLKEIGAALKIIRKTNKEKVILLHCVTEYPAPFDEINLKALVTMQKKFRLPVGYSDHTLGMEIALGAVALGASVIEKHFTLDRNMEGPDHKASLDPREFKHMVQSIRTIESALGDGIKRPSLSEKKNIPIVRRSVVAACNLFEGDRLQEKNIEIKRPGYGIQPGDISKIIGRPVKCDIVKDSVITWKMVA